MRWDLKKKRTIKDYSLYAHLAQRFYYGLGGRALVL